MAQVTIICHLNARSNAHLTRHTNKPFSPLKFTHIILFGVGGLQNRFTHLPYYLASWLLVCRNFCLPYKQVVRKLMCVIAEDDVDGL